MSLAIVIVCRGVENRTVVPDGQIIGSPLEADLQIVVLGDQLQEIGLEDLTLALGDVVDPAALDLVAGAEERFPARDGVCAHDWVRGLEVDAGVFWCAALFFDEFFAEFLGHLDEVGLVVCRREVVGDGLEGWAQSVVGFVARCPKCVAANVFWVLDDLEDRIVGGNAFEGDTGTWG